MQGSTHRMIHLLLCSDDREFVQAFAYYVHTDPDWCRRMKVTSFTTPEQLERYVDGHPLWDVCLCTLDFIPVMKKAGGQQDCLLLTEEEASKSGEVEGEQDDQLRKLYAYQPVPALLAEVERHAQMGENVSVSRNQSRSMHAGKGQVIAVYSAAGGTGKTTLALTLAKVWSRTRRVVYLTMEDIPSLPLFGKDDPLAEWLYVVRTCENNGTEAGLNLAEEALGRAIGRMQEAACDWIKPLRHPEDYGELGVKEFLQLRRMLLDNLHYDVVIADLPSAWHKHVHAVLEHSDAVICLVDGSTGCREKTARLVERKHVQHNRRPEKAWLFVNGKATDLRAVDEPDERLSYRMHAALPYVPAWKCNTGRFLQDHPVYTQAVARLAETLDGRANGRIDEGHSVQPPREVIRHELAGTRSGWT